MKRWITTILRFPVVVMKRRILTLLSIVLFGAIFGGCRCPSKSCVPCTGKAPCPTDITLATTTPQDVTEIVQTVHRLPSPTEEYRLLDEYECLNIAITNSAISRMLKLEQHLAGAFAECETRVVRRNLRLQRRILALYSDDMRSADAQEAMAAFYHLTELESAVEHLRALIQGATDAARRARELSDYDLAPNISPDDFDQSLLELEDRLAEVELRRLELNLQLQRKLGCTLATNEFFWPHTSPVVEFEPVDVDEAVAIGLSHRSDLRIIRLVMCNSDKDTMPVVRRILATVDGALGTATAQEGLHHRLRCIACSRHEPSVRCRQLQILLDDAERGATVEIRMAAFKVKSQYERIGLAQQALDSRKEHLRTLRSKREVENTTAFDITLAQNDVYKAEIDLIHHIGELRQAQLQLRHAQGILVNCGPIVD